MPKCYLGGWVGPVGGGGGGGGGTNIALANIYNMYPVFPSQIVHTTEQQPEVTLKRERSFDLTEDQAALLRQPRVLKTGSH